MKIVFSGSLPIEAVKYRSNKCNNVVLTGTFIGSIVAIICFIVWSILDNKLNTEFLSLSIILLILTVLLIVSKVDDSRLKFFNSNIIITITQEVIINESPFSKIEKPLNKVKKVVDKDDWYYIIFKFGDITNSWICAKNLITEGSIEEFEEIFKNKIFKK